MVSYGFLSKIFNISFLKYLHRLCVCVCVCYLAEGQAVFVLVFVFDLKVIQCFALRWSLTQGSQQLDVTCWQETVAPVQLAVVPVVVHLASQDDDVTLGKLEVPRFLAFVRVECLPTRQRWDVLQNKSTQFSTRRTIPQVSS